ncbi:hypothetical protein SAMN05421678_11840 [Actinopolymorpha cephalotaxi]|uniref:Uncharacterized protein n=1 Tax=Actinopolymorpha cephalotaxi TaxID=504797 RepID=A0A1I3A4J9_9ACTN|nr:hypothetical protein [Actinopolymorpha cephalotaxi]NYH85347.1 hypothetical protein [Actinopolymorpha cephalotaxi]SFH44984.1 hypothetical protein SAMN05421678_11840 [Actinopolymorpha cephalotaxi]
MTATVTHIDEQVKTYGELRHGDGHWGIRAEAHVMMRLKRMFPSAKGAGAIAYLSDTMEMARDIQWFTMRYPLVMSDETRFYLEQRADQHRSSDRAGER